MTKRAEEVIKKVAEHGWTTRKFAMRYETTSNIDKLIKLLKEFYDKGREIREEYTMSELIDIVLSQLLLIVSVDGDPIDVWTDLSITIPYPLSMDEDTINTIVIDAGESLFLNTYDLPQFLTDINIHYTNGYFFILMEEDNVDLD